MSQEDKDRYKKQQKTVSQIVAIFEAKEYSEENPQTGLKVMSLMNEVSLPPPEQTTIENAKFARNRCKSAEPHQQKSWASCHQELQSDLTGFHNSLGTATLCDPYFSVSRTVFTLGG